MNARIATIPQPAVPSAGRTYRGVSNEERRAERRQKLIEASLEVYGDVGFHAATVKQVCAQAGLTERYFYESFENSEALLVAGYLAVMDRLQGAIMAAVAAAPPGDMAAITRAAMTTYYGMLRETPKAARVFLVEILGVSPAIDTLYWDTIRRTSLSILGLWPGAAERLQAEGIDLDLFADGLVGAVVQIALGWVRAGYAQPLEGVVDTAMVILSAVNRQYT